MSAAPADEPPTPPDDLRHRVVRGGRLLAIRQGLGLALSVGGVLALTRLIGPVDYGVYAAAFGILFFAQTIGELNLDVFLVRHPGEPPEDTFHQVFTLLLVLGAVATGLMLAVTPLLASLVDLPDFTPVALVLFATIPVMHLQQLPLARLERELDYGRIGVVEVSGQVLFFAVALPLAVADAGVWAPVAGWCAQQLLLLAGFWRSSDYRPRLVWHPALVRDVLAYGAVATSSTSAYAVRNLVPPLLIGSSLGAAAVGYVSLATRLVEQLGFARMVIQRMSFAVLAKVVEERERLRRTLTQAIEVQVLAVGVPLVGFALVADVVIPIIFGDEWEPVADLMPLLVGPFIAMAAFNLPNAVMTIQARPWDLVLSQGASAALLWVAAAILVPAEGIEGYGYAELVAMASWVLTDRLLARRFPRPAYGVPALWWAVMTATALAPVLSWWLVAAPVLLVAVPASRHALVRVASLLLRRAAGEPVAA